MPWRDWIDTRCAALPSRTALQTLWSATAVARSALCCTPIRCSIRSAAAVPPKAVMIFWLATKTLRTRLASGNSSTKRSWYSQWIAASIPFRNRAGQRPAVQRPARNQVGNPQRLQRAGERQVREVLHQEEAEMRRADHGLVLP